MNFAVFLLLSSFWLSQKQTYGGYFWRSARPVLIFTTIVDIYDYCNTDMMNLLLLHEECGGVGGVWLWCTFFNNEAQLNYFLFYWRGFPSLFRAQSVSFPSICSPIVLSLSPYLSLSLSLYQCGLFLTEFHHYTLFPLHSLLFNIRRCFCPFPTVIVIPIRLPFMEFHHSLTRPTPPHPTITSPIQT